MQSDNCPERSRTLRAIERRVQNRVAIRNIDLLRCGGRLRTGEGADENKGQDAVGHGVAALASKWRPAVKLSRRVAAAQGGQDHKLVVRPGSRPCLSLRRRRYYILASRNAPPRAIQRPNRMHGGGGAYSYRSSRANAGRGRRQISRRRLPCGAAGHLRPLRGDRRIHSAGGTSLLERRFAGSLCHAGSCLTADGFTLRTITTVSV